MAKDIYRAAHDLNYRQLYEYERWREQQERELERIRAQQREDDRRRAQQREEAKRRK